jgi:hypothetical protein
LPGSRLPAFVFAVVLCFTGTAFAELIKIDQASTGDIIATLVGQEPSCQTIAPTGQISEVQGTTFFVLSEVHSTCTGTGQPLVPYTSVVDLGLLADGSYKVSWGLNTGFGPVGGQTTRLFAINGGAVVPDPAIPTLQQGMLFALSALVILGAAILSRRRSR